MKHLKCSIIALFILIATNVKAQLKIDAELRPRFEYRHGYKKLFADNLAPATFVAQRTRLNTSYKKEKLDFYISIQDVRVWGDVPQLNTSDNNGLSIHQAWAKVSLTTTLAAKVGRQEIIYDDSRIFGNVNWATQARSHDVAVLKYKKDKLKLDVGIAFNQDGEALTNTTLSTPKTYKSFQYAWLHNDWSNLSTSLLLLNNGMQYIDTVNDTKNETRFSQTLGTHLKYKKNKLDLSSNLYYQTGKDVNDNSLSAYLVGLEAKYKLTDKVKLGAGAEVQSGNDYGTPANGDNNAFSPLYGTNHKFNGFMDYFYVGNHTNSVGLIDFDLNAVFKIKTKSSLYLALHNFSAATDIAPNTSKQLGNEIDIVYTYKASNEITFKAGYSHLFTAEGMEILKGNTHANINNWAWAMLIIKPTLFTNITK